MYDAKPKLANRCCSLLSISFVQYSFSYAPLSFPFPLFNILSHILLCLLLRWKHREPGSEINLCSHSFQVETNKHVSLKSSPKQILSFKSHILDLKWRLNQQRTSNSSTSTFVAVTRGPVYREGTSSDSYN